MRILQAVAQTFSLLYRRFSTCRAQDALRRIADCKSAIRQITNLRYLLRPFCLLLGFSCIPIAAQQTATNDLSVRFSAVDIYVESKDKPLAAYQLEFSVTNGNAKIAGIEGGGHPAFAEPPFYDPLAIQHERVIIAAFSTNAASRLPNGKTRVATIHLQVSGTAESEFELKVQTAADQNGNKIPVEATVEERKAK